MINGEGSFVNNDLTLSYKWTSTQNPKNSTTTINLVASLSSSKDAQSISGSGAVSVNGSSVPFNLNSINLVSNTPVVISQTSTVINHNNTGDSIDVPVVISFTPSNVINGITYQTITYNSTISLDRINYSPEITNLGTLDTSTTTSLSLITYKDSVVNNISILDQSTKIYTYSGSDNEISVSFSTDTQVSILKSHNGYYTGVPVTLEITSYLGGVLVGSRSYSTTMKSVDYTTGTSSDIKVLDTVPYSLVGNQSVTNQISIITESGITITSTTAPSMNGFLMLSSSETNKLLSSLVGLSSERFYLLISSTLGDYTFYKYSSGFYTVTSLNNATFNPFSFEGGSQPTISMNGSSTDTGYTYSFRMIVNSFDKSWLDTTITSSNYQLQFDADSIDKLYKSTTDSKVTSGTIEITTYYNHIQVRVPFKSTIQVTINNADPSLNDNFKWIDTNQSTVSVTNDPSYLVESLSIAQIILSPGLASGSKHATIKTVRISYNGVSKELPYDDNGMTIYEGLVDYHDINLIITVIDSRGYSSTKSKTGSSIPYSKPSITSSSASRTNSISEDVQIKIQGQYDLLTIEGTNKNSIKNISYRSKSSNSDTWSPYSNLDYSSVTDLFLVSSDIVLDSTVDWTIEVSLSDNLSDEVLQFTVGTPSPILFIDTLSKSIGIGKFPTGKYPLEVEGDIGITGNVISEDDHKFIELSSPKMTSDTKTAVELTFPDGLVPDDYYVRYVKVLNTKNESNQIYPTIQFKSSSLLLTPTINCNMVKVGLTKI